MKGEPMEGGRVMLCGLVLGCGEKGWELLLGGYFGFLLAEEKVGSLDGLLEYKAKEPDLGLTVCNCSFSSSVS